MLDESRARIDSIDDELARLFVERLKITGEIAGIKKENNLPVFNPARESEIINRITKEIDGDTAGYLEILFNTIFDLSKSQQEKLIGSG